MKKLPLALSVLLIGAMTSVAQRGNPEVQYAGQSVDKLIADYMRDHKVPGMAVAIVQAPYITRVTGFGLGDPKKQLLSSSQTIFNIGQMAEAYTAVALMQLVEQGKISLDDPAGKHAKDAPEAWAGKTVREVLQKQTGLPDEGTGADLLRKVIEGASGRSYQEFVRSGQFEPLGLKQTYFASELGKVPQENPAPGEKHGKFLHAAAYINPTEAAVGHAGDKVVATAPKGTDIYASAEDISVWDIGLAGDILIKDPALRKMLYVPEGTKTASTGPWYFPGHKGLMVTTGDGAGFSSLLSRFTDPQELVCVTLLANKEGLDLSQLARQIAGAYDAKIGPPPSTAGMRVQQSPYPVKETMDRLESALKGKGVGVMARVDHAQSAKKANLELAPTEEILFGNPANGTLLMQSNRAVAVDLPLRAVAWEENGAVWLAATDPVEIARRHNITDRQEDVLRMRNGLDAALLKAVSAD